MAWGLKFDGVNDYVPFLALASTNTGSNISWDMEFLLKNVSATDSYTLGESSTNNYLIARANGNIDFRASAVTTSFVGAVSDTTIYNKILLTLRWTGGNRVLTLTVNDVLFGSFNITTATVPPFTTSGKLGANYRPAEIQYIKYTDNNNSSNNRYYDSTLSSHTAGIAVWADVSGNDEDGVSVGMPTDGSAWVNLGAAVGSWAVESSGIDDYMEAATLGDLTASKIRVVLERVTWDTEGYLFSQAGNTSFTRELGLYIFGGNYGIILGGTNNTNIGSEAGNPIVDVTVDVTVDYGAGTLLFIVDGVAVYDAAIFTGVGRVDGELFRIFARGGGAYAPLGTRVGNTQVYLDDILVRNYDFDNSSHGAGVVTVSETVSSSNLIGINMLTDGDAWIELGGGVTNDIVTDFDLPQLTFEAVIDNDNQTNNVTTSFDLSQLAFSSVIDNAVIENDTTTAFELSPLSFSTVINNTSENSITTDFNLSELSFSAVVDNDNQTNNTITAFNLSPLSFSAVIDNTIVDNTVTTNFALNALQFSTQVQNGDFSPVFIASNNVIQVSYSTSIIQLTYSTNIQGK